MALAAATTGAAAAELRVGTGGRAMIGRGHTPRNRRYLWPVAAALAGVSIGLAAWVLSPRAETDGAIGSEALVTDGTAPVRALPPAPAPRPVVTHGVVSPATEPSPARSLARASRAPAWTRIPAGPIQLRFDGDATGISVARIRPASGDKGTIHLTREKEFRGTTTWAGRAIVEIDKEGFARRVDVAEIEIVPGVPVYDVVLPRTELHVYLSVPEDYSEARVTVRKRGRAWLWGALVSLPRLSSGRTVIRGLPPGDYFVFAESNSYAPGTLVPRVPELDVRPVTLGNAHAAAGVNLDFHSTDFRVEVVDEHDRPVPRATVDMRGVGDQPFPDLAFRNETDDNGVAHFRVPWGMLCNAVAYDDHGNYGYASCDGVNGGVLCVKLLPVRTVSLRSDGPRVSRVRPGGEAPILRFDAVEGNPAVYGGAFAVPRPYGDKNWRLHPGAWEATLSWDGGRSSESVRVLVQPGDAHSPQAAHAPQDVPIPLW